MKNRDESGKPKKIFTRLSMPPYNVDYTSGEKVIMPDHRVEIELCGSRERNPGEYINTVMFWCKDVDAANLLRKELEDGIELLDFYTKQMEESGEIKFVR